MIEFLQIILISIALVIGLLVLSLIHRRFFPRPPRGIHFGASAAAWAERHFALEHRPIAAFVAELLCDQLGVELTQLEQQTRFIDDLGMTELEPVEVVMALEEDLGIDIPDEDAERIHTISDLVCYLYERLDRPNEVA